jgi:hypothetical protein
MTAVSTGRHGSIWNPPGMQKRPLSVKEIMGWARDFVFVERRYD